MEHHARLYITQNSDKVIADIKAGEEAVSEIIPFVSETITIDDVRRIIQLSYQTPGAKDFRLILVSARQIAVEAQHAFLKTLEEPPVTTRFVIVLPTLAGLLPTVLSRVSLIASVATGSQYDLFDQFVEQGQKERLEVIADIAKRKADSEYGLLYDGLVAYAQGQKIRSEDLRLVTTCLMQLRQKGASKKMIWEELALSLPKLPDSPR